jgi:hypothetical protein
MSKVERAGLFAKSMLAWKVATFQQAVLYRVIELAEGARLAWNHRNTVVTFLAVRALVETVAVFDNLEQGLLQHLGEGNIGALNSLIMNRMFATRDEVLLADHPELHAVNVLTLIGKLQKRYDLEVMSNYESMSERCHPNSAGHHQMYTITDKSTGTVTFTEAKNHEMTLVYILAPLGLLFLFERSMNVLDDAIPKLADLQHRLKPVVAD